MKALIKRNRVAWGLGELPVEITMERAVRGVDYANERRPIY